MYIQPFSLPVTVNHNKKVMSQPLISSPKFENINKKDVFQPSFNGYNKLLEAVTIIDYKKDKAVGEAFGALFEELIKEPKILQKAGASEIIEMYKKEGFRGLMHELWKAFPDASIEKIIEKSENEPQVLISKEGKPLLEIFNIGRQGFWNSLFNRKSAPRDVRLTFLSQDEKHLFEFSLDKYGAVSIWQKRPTESVYTEFHNSTGNRKMVVRHPHGVGNPETEYFKPNGLEDDLKNHIEGGTAIGIW